MRAARLAIWLSDAAGVVLKRVMEPWRFGYGGRKSFLKINLSAMADDQSLT